MKHINTIKTRDLCESAKNGGCGECQTSCQSACKTAAALQTRLAKTKTNKLYGLKSDDARCIGSVALFKVS